MRRVKKKNLPSQNNIVLNELFTNLQKKIRVQRFSTHGRSSGTKKRKKQEILKKHFFTTALKTASPPEESPRVLSVF